MTKTFFVLAVLILMGGVFAYKKLEWIELTPFGPCTANYCKPSDLDCSRSCRFDHWAWNDSDEVKVVGALPECKPIKELDCGFSVRAYGFRVPFKNEFRVLKFETHASSTSANIKACVSDADCKLWPSGCCKYEAVNKSFNRPADPNSVCEMKCESEPKGVACVSNECVAR